LTATEKEGEELTSQVQELRSALEMIHSQQSEDSRSISKQQKTTERYLAKRQMLTSRKDECNRNIRDLGVLPEEAFEKYVNEKLERVRSSFYMSPALSSNYIFLHLKSSLKNFTL
jgi:structural maintenance of chromosome 3 (chondroitin sulfate proteoglycan 6)